MVLVLLGWERVCDPSSRPRFIGSQRFLSAPLGLALLVELTHRLRGGLQSFAASELLLFSRQVVAWARGISDGRFRLGFPCLGHALHGGGWLETGGNCAAGRYARCVSGIQVEHVALSGGSLRSRWQPQLHDFKSCPETGPPHKPSFSSFEIILVRSTHTEDS